jgi:osmotically inducible protein OsmC
MPVSRTATTVWTGTLFEGSGEVTLNSSGIGTYPVNWPARSAEPNGTTSPEELIAAAHSSCFSMAFSNGLANNNTPATTLTTTAAVEFTPGTGITGIALAVEGVVAGLTQDEFVALATAAKEGCPVSQALKAVPITLSANLKA